jgi:phosphopentomutase
MTEKNNVIDALRKISAEEIREHATELQERVNREHAIGLNIQEQLTKRGMRPIASIVSTSQNVTDQASVLGVIAQGQSVSVPIVTEQQQFDIRIQSRRAEFQRVTDEIKAMNERHEQRVASLNAEHAENVARLASLQENINRVIRVLDAANNMLSRDVPLAPEITQ